MLLLSLPLAVSLHICEEFLLPGGFQNWYRSYRPDIAASLTTRFLVTINAVLIAVAIAPAIIGATPQGISLWLTVAAILFGNSWFHIIAAVKTKKYNPGLATSILFYLPLPVYGYMHFLATGGASPETAVAAFAIGSTYQWWSLYNHRRRSQKA